MKQSKLLMSLSNCFTYHFFKCENLRIAFEIIKMSDPSQVTLHEIKTNENWKILAEKKIFFAKVVIVFARTCKEKYFCKLFISLLLCLLLKKTFRTSYVILLTKIRFPCFIWVNLQHHYFLMLALALAGFKPRT